MDEFRANFALVNIGNEVPGNAVEIMIPGCHSDVGGSYLDEKKKCKIQKIDFSNRYKMCFQSSNVKPGPSNVGDVNSSTLQDIGWINGETATVTQENDKYVEMERSIKRGYSDIPLAMMIQYFCRKVENINKVNMSRFFTQIPIEHTYSRLNDLKKIGDSFVEKIKDLGEGQRWWFLMPNHSNPLQRIIMVP